MLCYAMVCYAINFEIHFRTINIYLKDAQVKDVHEGERTSKKAGTMWQRRYVKYIETK